MKRVEVKPTAAERTRDQIKGASNKSFEVWEIDIQSGTVVMMGVQRNITEPYAHTLAKQFNAEEAITAYREIRLIRSEFIVVKASTTYKRVNP